MSKLIQKVDDTTGEETAEKVNSDEVNFPVLPLGTNGQTPRYNSSNEIEANSNLTNRDDFCKMSNQDAESNPDVIAFIGTGISSNGASVNCYGNKAGNLSGWNIWTGFNPWTELYEYYYKVTSNDFRICNANGSNYGTVGQFLKLVDGNGKAEWANLPNIPATQQGANQDSNDAEEWVESDISFSLSANTQYELNLNLLFDVSTELTGNIRLYSTQSFSAIGIVQKNAQDTPDMIHQSLNMSNSASVNYSLNASLGTGYSNIFKANLLVIATVDFQINLQFKQNADDPLNWVRLKAGSFGVVRKA